MWCIGKITPQYRQRMYALLELYQLPYKQDEPVVCVDEKSKQLLAAKRPAIDVKPGQTRKEDYEYERQGTRNLFVAVEPLGGWRQVQVTQRIAKRQILSALSVNCCKVAIVMLKRCIWWWIILTPTLPRCLSK